MNGRVCANWRSHQQHCGLPTKNLAAAELEISAYVSIVVTARGARL